MKVDEMTSPPKLKLFEGWVEQICIPCIQHKSYIYPVYVHMYACLAVEALYILIAGAHGAMNGAFPPAFDQHIMD